MTAMKNNDFFSVSSWAGVLVVFLKGRPVVFRQVHTVVVHTVVKTSSLRNGEIELERVNVSQGRPTVIVIAYRLHVCKFMPSAVEHYHENKPRLAVEQKTLNQ